MTGHRSAEGEGKGAEQCPLKVGNTAACKVSIASIDSSGCINI